MQGKGNEVRNKRHRFKNNKAIQRQNCSPPFCVILIVSISCGGSGGVLVLCAPTGETYNIHNWPHSHTKINK